MMDSLSTALLGVAHGQVTLERISQPASELQRTLQDFFAGRRAFLSWRKLAIGGDPSLRETRHLIEVEAVRGARLRRFARSMRDALDRKGD